MNNEELEPKSPTLPEDPEERRKFLHIKEAYDATLLFFSTHESDEMFEKLDDIMSLAVSLRERLNNKGYNDNLIDHCTLVHALAGSGFNPSMVDPLENGEAEQLPQIYEEVEQFFNNEFVPAVKTAGFEIEPV